MNQEGVWLMLFDISTNQRNKNKGETEAPSQSLQRKSNTEIMRIETLSTSHTHDTST